MNFDQSVDPAVGRGVKREQSKHPIRGGMHSGTAVLRDWHEGLGVHVEPSEGRNMVGGCGVVVVVVHDVWGKCAVVINVKNCENYGAIAALSVVNLLHRNPEST